MKKEKLRELKKQVEDHTEKIINAQKRMLEKNEQLLEGLRNEKDIKLKTFQFIASQIVKSGSLVSEFYDLMSIEEQEEYQKRIVNKVIKDSDKYRIDLMKGIIYLMIQRLRKEKKEEWDSLVENIQEWEIA